MPYKQLWVFVEGSDDERFFKRVIKPTLSTQYDSIRVWQYAQQPTKNTKNFLNAIQAMNARYFFLGDINNSPCATAKKEKIRTQYKKSVNTDNVIIVIKEIESWYLAGLDAKACRKLGIKAFRNTNNVTKEDFNNLIPEKYARIDFMTEVLNRFSVEIGKRKNLSFAHFMKKM